jgi:regulatory protein
MPFITKISQQLKAKHRYSIFIDKKYRCSLSATELSLSGWREGVELTEEDVETLLKAAAHSKSMERVYGLLAVRARSRSEVEQYLKRKGTDDPAERATVIDRLETAGLINDTDFAGHWINDRRQVRPRSKRMIELELMKKGVSRDDIETAIGDWTGDDELTSAKKLATKKLATYKGDQQKVINYLCRNGFSFATAQAALQELEIETAESA